MDTIKDKKDTIQEGQKSTFLTPLIKERLKVIASIIVERIIEDQQNGTLRFKMQRNK